ncbi:hypothetical protein, partial [Puniceibacterium antarcticum]|uniref:hypothetical protein n=1 Tax=Puniceibacterium antarcticum TaxID=1206336 RepID=UPI001C557BF4
FRTRQMFVGQRTQMINASCDTHAFGMTLELVPKQHSTGGKASLGKTSNPLGTMLRMTLPGNGWDSVTYAPSWSLEPWQSFRLSSGSTPQKMAG